MWVNIKCGKFRCPLIRLIESVPCLSLGKHYLKLSQCLFSYDLGNKRIHLSDLGTKSVGDIFKHNWEAQIQTVRFLWQERQVSIDLDTNSGRRFSIFGMVSCWMMLSVHQGPESGQLFHPWTLLFLFPVHPTNNLVWLGQCKGPPNCHWWVQISGCPKKQLVVGKDPIYPHCFTRLSSIHLAYKNRLKSYSLYPSLIHKS